MPPSEENPGVSSQRATAIVVVLGLGTGLLYVATAFIERALFANGAAESASIIARGYPASRMLMFGQLVLYALVSLSLIGAYLRVVAMSRRGQLDGARQRFWALAIPVIIHFGFLGWTPTLSEDTLSYVAHGVLGQLPGHNPLLEAVEVARTTSWKSAFAVYGWHAEAGISPYGILWTRLEIAVAGLSGGDIGRAVLMLKSVAILASLGSAWCIWSLAGRLDSRLQLTATLAYLWNPLVIMEFAAEGHNDAALCLFTLGALAACVAGRPAVMLISGSLGVLTKYVTILYIPAQLSLAWRRRRGSWWFLSQAVLAIVAVFLLAVLLYSPLWAGTHTFDGIIHRANPVSSGTLFGAVNWLLRRSPLRNLAGPLTTIVMTLPLLGLVAWGSLRVKDAAELAAHSVWISLAYLLIASPDYWPWYACLPIALIVVGAFDSLFWLAVLMTAAARLVAPLEILRDHGHMSFQWCKGLITGVGSLLPLVAVAAWLLFYARARRGSVPGPVVP